jgi:hypothetical protein
MAKSMNGQLSMFNQTTSPDSSSAISSPASADGATPCDSPDGLTTEPSGPEVAPASRSRVRRPSWRRRSARPLAGVVSSSSRVPPCVVFGEQVESAIGHGWLDRLCDDLEAKATPSGRLVCRLRASARSTSDSACGSWPTPDKSSGDGGRTASSDPLARSRGERLELEAIHDQRSCAIGNVAEHAERRGHHEKMSATGM